MYSQTQRLLKKRTQNVREAFLICEIQLPQNYNQEIWEEIVEMYTPESFQKQNKKIYQQLLKCEKLFNKYFTLFYNNHLILKNWYTLSSNKHWQMGLYQCKWIFRKSLKDYKEEMRKSNIEEKVNQNRRIHCSRSLSKERTSSIRKSFDQGNQQKEVNKKIENKGSINLDNLSRFHKRSGEQGSKGNTLLSSKRKVLKTEQLSQAEKSRKQPYLDSQQAVQGLANEIFNYFSKNSHCSNQKKKHFNIHKSAKNHPSKMSKVSKQKKSKHIRESTVEIISEKNYSSPCINKQEDSHQSLSKTMGISMNWRQSQQNNNNRKNDRKRSSIFKINHEEEKQKQLVNDNPSKQQKNNQIISQNNKKSRQNQQQQQQSPKNKIKKFGKAQCSQPSYSPSKKDLKNMNKQINNQNYDFHDLYLQTFHACDGLRYIFYNFQKHMKGLSEKQKYNTFIRQNKHLNSKNYSNMLSTGNNFQAEVEQRCQFCLKQLQKDLSAKKNDQIQGVQRNLSKQQNCNLRKSQEKQSKNQQNQQNSSNQKQRRKVLKTSIANFSSVNSQFTPFQELLLNRHNFIVKTQNQNQNKQTLIQSQNKTLLKSKNKYKGLNSIEAIRKMKNIDKNGVFGFRCQHCSPKRDQCLDSCANPNHFHVDCENFKKQNSNQKQSFPKDQFYKTSYQFSPIGYIKESIQKKSQVIFRRIKTRNHGKFVRI